ncbi:MAG TPA: penicillin-binding protein 2 [Actinomycetota bacterium]|nr:penicillin-binding protein 2 [Actinomycetota bacterium]
MTEGRAGLRLKVLAVLVAGMFAALSTRLWYLQVLAAERFRREAQHNSVRLVDVPAPRGRILDRNRAPLVENRLSLVVTVNRQELGDEAESVLLRLSELLGIRVRVLAERLQDPRYYSYQPVPVAQDISEDAWFTIEEHPEEFPGVQVVETPVRRYPHGRLAAHVLGHVGPITADQLGQERFRGYDRDDLVGQAGVEAVYERWLQGREGIVKYLVNAAGEPIRRLGERPPVRGYDVVLSLDLGVQRLVEEALASGMEHARAIFDPETGRYLRADAGAAVVLDPDTGEIVALASWPTFAPAIYQGGLTTEEAARLERPAAHQPLFNRATQGAYPPGSTFKPFVALAAVREGIASLSGSYPCPPTFTVPGDESGTVFRNWTSRDFGYLSLASSLVVSCDTVFYRFGYGFWQLLPPGVQGLTQVARPEQEVLQRELRRFGFGAAPGLDLPSAGAGLLPGGRWKYETFRDDWQRIDPFNRCIAYWCPGDYVNMSIGQGYVLVTPLQLAAAYGAIANGGRLCQPHVGLRVERPLGPGRAEVVKRIRPRCRRIRGYTPEQFAYVRQALAQVPASGTAASAFAGFPLDQVPVAGKTGTAEVPSRQAYSWFAAMVPADDPEYVIVVLVEQGGHGSTTAAPIVRGIIEGLYGLPSSGFVSGGVTD